MNNNDYDADFDNNESVAGANGLRWMSMLVIVLIIFGFFSLVWYAYNATDMTSAQDAVPTITSDTQDYKVKPEEVGGLRVVNKDIESYELMRRNPSDIEESKVVERLRPEAESPVVLERIEEVSEIALEDVQDTVSEIDARFDAAGNAVSETTVAAVQSAEDKLDVLVNDPSRPTYKVVERTESLDVVAPVKEVVAEATTTVQTATDAVEPEKAATDVVKSDVVEPIQKIAEPALPVKNVQAAPAQVIAPKIAEAPAKPSVAPANTAVYVQLAALRSESEAERLWDKLSSQHSAVLAGMGHYVQPVEVAGSGTLYRLRATGMSSHAAAASLCAKLKARSLTCISSK